MGHGGRGRRGRGGGVRGARALGVLAGPTADGDVTEGPTLSPVTAAGLAEVAWLGEVVVVVVAELGVGRVAAWAWQWLRLGRRWVAHALLGPSRRSSVP